MKLKSIFGISFGSVAVASGLLATSLYLPQVAGSASFYGTQVIDNNDVYKKLNSSSEGVTVFNSNGNVGKFIGGTPNVSLDILLNGTNSYANGNYVVLFTSDGDPLSNLFLYGNSYRFNANETTATTDFHKFGFSINKKTNKIEFNRENVEANYQNGYLQSSFKYLTNLSALNIMAALPSIVLVHDKIDYDVMKSLINYQEYVTSCFHDVVINLNGTYSFARDTENYKKFVKNNPKLSPNYEVAEYQELFELLVGYKKDMKPEDKDYKKNEKLKAEAEKLSAEYKWAFDLKQNDPICFNFQFNPLNSSFEPNTYTGPHGETKYYRTDIGAKKYIESFNQFKSKLSPAYVETVFQGQKNGGHFIGFAHSASSETSVVLNNELSNIPKDSSGNESTNLTQFAGVSAGSKFTASLISLYNSVTNGAYKGQTIKRFINNKQIINSNIAWTPMVDKKTVYLKEWYIAK